MFPLCLLYVQYVRHSTIFIDCGGLLSGPLANIQSALQINVVKITKLCNSILGIDISITFKKLVKFDYWLMVISVELLKICWN